jgi:plastocyanin
MIAKRKTTAKQTWRLAVLLLTAFTWGAESGNNESGNAAPENRATGAILMVDQYGRQALSGKRDVGGQIFDVTVGPVGNELTFMPDTVNISVGDTVRWTWASNHHSVTSGADCVADGQFCSPDNMNCDAGIVSNTGSVYEFTFTQPGIYQYFCDPHCFAGMTGVVIVMPAVRPLPNPRPRPTPWPRP